MSSLSMFLKKNKAVKENAFFPATASLCDEDGKPLLWEIKPLTTKDNDRIQNECMKEVPIPGKPNMYRHKLDTNTYIGKLLTASVIFPDLYNAELQDSYGVKTPEELLIEIIDDPGEYNAFIQFVQKISGLDKMMAEQVEEAKN